MIDMRINAIIWDYDGTLVDTRMKNFSVTKTIVSKIANGKADNYPALNSLENYVKANEHSSNWRELYRNEFGFDEKQIDYAGNLWTQYQLSDKTEVDLFEGIRDVVLKFGDYPQGIVSQNSSDNIKLFLERIGLLKHFDMVIGYEEVDLSRQKPNPQGLISCISTVANSVSNPLVIYIGDHKTDIQCAHNANGELKRKAVTSILIDRSSGNSIKSWAIKPDHYASNSKEIIEIIENLVKLF
jgi:HAD superfamily hydrolase (TIGR01549 family)